MTIKQKFAETALDLKESLIDATSESAFSAIACSVVFSVFASVGTAAVIDCFKELENTELPEQQKALDQYEQALTVLSEQRALANNASHKNKTPNYLKAIIGTTESTELETNISTADLDKEKANYQKSITNFISSAHIDQRLNEVQMKQLFTKLESEHGYIPDISDFRTPDYNDIQECRAIPEINNNPISINSCTQGPVDIDWLTIFLTITASPWLLAGAVSTQNKRLERWANNDVKPNNH